MPIGTLNVRILYVAQKCWKPIPGYPSQSHFSRHLVYPDAITASPEELFDEFKRGADPKIFEESQIADGTTIRCETHNRALKAFTEWLAEKGFKALYEFEKELPVLEIPPQVNLTNLRSRYY